MDRIDLYRDIAQRTQGDIYIGVVGPVRTGKSTFIKRFLELLILPGVENEFVRNRVVDELPQSGSGKTIMTTQPKFVPNEAVQLSLDEKTDVNIRMVDCVGYMVPGAIGHTENDVPRMVRTPWYDHDIPFEEAAEVGTRKVITEHSTIGIVMTTDGSITDLPRSAYLDAEERVILELKDHHKPFVVVLNSRQPDGEEAKSLADALHSKYDVNVIAMDVMAMTAEDACKLLEEVLMEFPLRMIHLQLPSWMLGLPQEHYLVQRLMMPITQSMSSVNKMRDYALFLSSLEGIQDFMPANLIQIDLGNGKVVMESRPEERLFYQILGEECGYEIKDDYHLIKTIKEFVSAKREYDRLAEALYAVRSTGYGLVPPLMDEMELEVPEIVQQGSRFGVKLKAKASSMHMIRIDIESEISPLVGTEEQSEELVAYLMDTFEKDPQGIWQTNIFGKPLYDLVKDGMTNKVNRMPEEVQQKLRETLQRIANDGCSNLFCIML